LSNELTVIAPLVVNIGRKVLVLALDLVDRCLACSLVVISGREMIPMVLLATVFGAARRKVELDPRINIVWIRNCLVAICLLSVGASIEMAAFEYCLGRP
jgi:hypothetical protein